MKTMIWFLLLLNACSNGGDTVNVEGIYARYATSEYSRAWDTLIIFPFDGNAGNYLVRRKTGIERTRPAGSSLPLEYRSEEMMGNYDAASRQLRELKHGRVFTFRDDELLFGTAVYKRISK